MSTLTTIFFLGGWLPPTKYIFHALYYSLPVYIPKAAVAPIFDFLLSPQSAGLWMSLKVQFMMLFFIWVRAGLPRYRYDQLMRLGWKVILPLSLGFTVLTPAILYVTDGLPPSF